jgi:hypothetical protein
MISPMHKRLTAAAITFVALLVPAAASADTTIAPGANAGRMTALGGTVVWVTGDDARQRLMMYTAAGGRAARAGSGDADLVPVDRSRP